MAERAGDDGTDWTTQATDTLEQVVATVRERTVEPAQKLTRAVVFGTLAACFVLPALLLLLIGAFRALVNYLPASVDPWGAWYVLAGIFLVVGAFCWARKEAR